MLLVSPLLLPLALRRRLLPWTFAGLLALSFALTLWQARWGYFFAAVFLFTVPAQFTLVRPKWLAAAALMAAQLPLLLFWDGTFWPNDATAERRGSERIALAQWRAVATSLGGAEPGAILAPWWLAPATAYWSGQPVVAGSSHESLPGIVASARFFLSTTPEESAEILRGHRVKWVLADDGERAATNSAAILGRSVPTNALCLELARAPSQVPVFLRFIGKRGACSLFEVRDFRRK